MISKRIQKILEAVNDKVKTLLWPDTFYVALYDPIRSRLEFPWVSGNNECGWESRSLNKARLPDSIISRGSYLLFGQDFAKRIEKDDLTYLPAEKIPEAWLGVPITFEERVLGALVVESETAGAFDERSANLLKTIAGQTATAIENARLYERLKRRIDDLDAVNQIGQHLTSGIQLKEQEIIELIREQAGKLMDTDNMYIALYDEDTDTVRFPMIFVDGKPINVEARSGGMGLTEWIIRNRKPIHHCTKQDSDVWYEEDERRQNYIKQPFVSWVGVPMLVRDRVIGVIATYHADQEYVYDEHDLQILSSMASQAAIALDNARLYEHLDDLVSERTRQLEERTRQLEALQDIGVEITSRLDVHDVLGSIAQHATELLGADFSTIFTYDHHRRKIETGVRRGVTNSEPYIPSENSFTVQIAKQQQHKLVGDVVEELPDTNPTEVDGKPVKSFVVLPLVIGRDVKETVGVLYVDYFEKHGFTEQEKEVIGLLANQAAVAIQNAKMFDELERAQIKIVEREAIINRTSFAADFVHRLNNLAGTIPGWVDVIREHLRERQVADIHLDEYLNNIEDEADALLREAERLKSPPKKSEVDLEMLLESLVRQTRVQMPESVHINFSSQSPPPAIYAVRSELADAFWNIMENGLHAINYEGNLSVDLRMVDSSQWYEIQIKDDGPGISDYQKDIVFKPFATTKNGHAGYGLWRAKYVIESLGGNINFIDNKPVGTIFIVRLPNIKLEYKNE